MDVRSSCVCQVRFSCASLGHHNRPIRTAGVTQKRFDHGYTLFEKTGVPHEKFCTLRLERTVMNLTPSCELGIPFSRPLLQSHRSKCSGSCC